MNDRFKHFDTLKLLALLLFLPKTPAGNSFIMILYLTSRRGPLYKAEDSGFKIWLATFEIYLKFEKSNFTTCFIANKIIVRKAAQICEPIKRCVKFPIGTGPAREIRPKPSQTQSCRVGHMYMGWDDKMI